ncbi:MAG: nicotinate-nucleotide--dimethylbenzimidazole phosphoribosyltransferase [Syntrophales bacterium]|nr:nicotinate-nucleotide--dimethylbenzimidazole phosphoribosyltransferase [Syntrophales bacterium]
MLLLEDTVNRITPQDGQIRQLATKKLEQLTMPYWALGRLMDLAVELAGITGRIPPPVKRKTVIVMAADHGVVWRGVSKYPQAVTLQMLHNFVNGRAAINAIAKVVGARVVVVDMGVAGDTDELIRSGKIIDGKIAPGTADMCTGPAMTRNEAVRSIEAGIRVVHELNNTTDVFATGEMGIGNTTSSSAIIAVFTRSPVETVTGRGTGLDDRELAYKVSIIKKIIEINEPDPKDPISVLARVGGFEIGGIVGLILGAASLKKPVLVDGFISTAAAIIASHLAPLCRYYMIASHRSEEKGHQIALDYLGLKPLINLNMRLGEGTGAALTMPFLDAASALFTDVATFEEAKVSKS